MFYIYKMKRLDKKVFIYFVWCHKNKYNVIMINIHNILVKMIKKKDKMQRGANKGCKEVHAYKKK